MADERQSMAGKTVLITGGTSGIGRATAIGLAALGARVAITGRDLARTETAAADIRRATGNPAVDAFAADLSSQAEVRRLAAEVLAAYPRLDVLVNNVGGSWATATSPPTAWSAPSRSTTWPPSCSRTCCCDRLEASAPARVVTVSSAAQATGTIDFDDLQGERDYSERRAYPQSKLASVLFTYELARPPRRHRRDGERAAPRGREHGLRRGGSRRHLQGARPVHATVHEDPGRGRGHVDLPCVLAGGRGRRPGRYFADSRPRTSSRASYDGDGRDPPVGGQRRPGGPREVARVTVPVSPR